MVTVYGVGHSHAHYENQYLCGIFLWKGNRISLRGNSTGHLLFSYVTLSSYDASTSYQTLDMYIGHNINQIASIWLSISCESYHVLKELEAVSTRHLRSFNEFHLRRL